MKLLMHAALDLQHFTYLVLEVPPVTMLTAGGDYALPSREPLMICAILSLWLLEGFVLTLLTLSVYLHSWPVI